MKWGGRITDAQAIIGLLVISAACVMISFIWFPFRIIGAALAFVAAICAIGIWQIILNEAYRESRSDKGKCNWNLLSTFRKRRG